MKLGGAGMALKDLEAMAERCSNCSYCKWIPFDKVKDARFAENCPSSCYSKFNTYSARGRFQLGLALGKGELEYSEKCRDIITQCLSCGACDVACKVCRYNLEPLAYNIALKEDAAERYGLTESQRDAMNSLEKEQTMLAGRKKADRAKWADDFRVKRVTEEPAEVLFFPGCQYSYNERLHENLKYMLQLFIDAGADIGILGQADVCCGGRAGQQGLIKQFEDRAAKNIELFRKTGVRTIVTPCADCYHAFKREYAALGLNVRVLHAVEYLAELVKSGKIGFSKRLNMDVTYHDPCHLGREGEAYEAWNGHENKILNQIHVWEPRRPRYNGAHGIYDAPRSILNEIPGVRLKEMFRIREYSWCCGAGGGCSDNHPEFAEWTAAERVREAMETGAEAIITACPWCNVQLRSGDNINGKMIEVMDIFELVRLAR